MVELVTLLSLTVVDRLAGHVVVTEFMFVVCKLALVEHVDMIL